MNNESNKLELLKKQFSLFLKRNSYRNTQERFCIMDRIAELDEHFSADELYLYINNKGDRVSRATVYSTLDLLTQCDILMKHRFQGDSAHYELASRMPEHDHLICTECGRIVEFRAKDIDEIRERVCNEFGFRAKTHSLQIFAVCLNPSKCEYNKSE